MTEDCYWSRFGPFGKSHVICFIAGLYGVEALLGLFGDNIQVLFGYFRNTVLPHLIKGSLYGVLIKMLNAVLINNGTLLDLC